MGKYFLGSVGMAEAFRKGANGPELAFVSKTLTDSGLNISTTKDDIRAGTGAPIQFSFYHDASVEITLTDVLWKKEYLEAQLGANFEAADSVYDTFVAEFGENGALTKFDGVAVTGGICPKNILALPFGCDGNAKLAWGTIKGKDDWQSLEVSDDNKIVAPAAGEYCVRFLTDAGDDYNAKAAEITSTIVPEELVLVITAPIFAGDACAASKGEAAGRIIFEVPRFQLNGAQEFAMNMSQNQTMSLAGVALASASEDCNAAGGKLLRVIEVITNEVWEANAVEIIADEDYLKVGEDIVLYVALKDGSMRKIVDPKKTILIDGAAPASDKWAAQGEKEVKLVKNPAVSATVDIEA